MPKVYIHIGHTKTGSTSIQDTLLENYELFKQRNIIYYNDREVMFGTNDLPAALNIKFYSEPDMIRRGFDNEERRKKHARLVFSHIESLIRSNSKAKIIISSEVLASVDEKGVIKLDSFLKKSLDGASNAVRIICYVRDPLSWAVSTAQQEMKVYGKTFDDPIELVLPFRFYLEKYFNVFGRKNVDIRELGAGKSLLTDFMVACEEPDFDLRDVKQLRSNESLTEQSVRILDRLNRVVPAFEGELPNDKRAILIDKAFAAIKGDKFVLSPSVREEVVRRNQGEVEWLRSVVGHRIFADWSAPADGGQSTGEFTDEVLESIGRLINDILLREQHAKAKARFLEGMKCVKDGERAEAVDRFEAALRLKPDMEPAERRLAVLRAQMKRTPGKPSRARSKPARAEQAALKLKLDGLRASAAAGEQAGDWSAAIAAWEQIYALAPSHAHRMRLVSTLYNAGEVERSYRLLVEALKLGAPGAGPVRRGFAQAVDFNDREALPLFADAYKAVLADPDLPRPDKPSMNIWLGLIWLGEIEAAVDHMQAPPAVETDLTVRGPERRAVIVDPAFAPATGHGHHFNTNLAYLHLLSKLGARSTFYGAYEAGSPSDSLGFDFHPAFTIAMYAVRTTFDDLRLLRNINRYFEAELDRQLPPDRDVLIFHSTRYTTILGLARWMARHQGADRSSLVIGIIDSELDVHPTRQDLIRAIYREAMATLKQLKNTEILVYCETQRHIDRLTELGGEGLDIRLFPYIASSLALEHAQPHPTSAAENDRLMLGYVGATRLERGADLLPGLVRDTMGSPGEKVRWTVQLDVEDLRRIAGPRVDADVAFMESHVAVALVEGKVSIDDYYAMLDRMDIVVLPYRRRYEVSGSGVFVEALTLGKVQVLPERGWMTELARKYGCDPVTFREATPVRISAAIESAVERYPELKAKALRAADIWNTEESSAAQLEAWLGKRVANNRDDGRAPPPIRSAIAGA